mmetsp:Transcript_33645/g.83888  ORF Transcript_33645/g.83888 Transcript_33645/m.83888 type:complete len:100 (-) Transcript_33645:176-475(-)
MHDWGVIPGFCYANAAGCDKLVAFDVLPGPPDRLYYTLVHANCSQLSQAHQQGVEMVRLQENHPWAGAALERVRLRRRPLSSAALSSRRPLSRASPRRG